NSGGGSISRVQTAAFINNQSSRSRLAGRGPSGLTMRDCWAGEPRVPNSRFQIQVEIMQERPLEWCILGVRAAGYRGGTINDICGALRQSGIWNLETGIDFQRAPRRDCGPAGL